MEYDVHVPKKNAVGKSNMAKDLFLFHPGVAIPHDRSSFYKAMRLPNLLMTARIICNRDSNAMIDPANGHFVDKPFSHAEVRSLAPLWKCGWQRPLTAGEKKPRLYIMLLRLMLMLYN